jgi:hypothetical protein
VVRTEKLFVGEVFRKYDVVTVDPGSNPDHDKLGGEGDKFIVRRVNYN